MPWRPCRLYGLAVASFGVCSDALAGLGDPPHRANGPNIRKTRKLDLSSQSAWLLNSTSAGASRRTIRKPSKDFEAVAVR
jgi:hypothetical protein